MSHLEGSDIEQLGYQPEGSGILMAAEANRDCKGRMPCGGKGSSTTAGKIRGLLRNVKHLGGLTSILFSISKCHATHRGLVNL